MVHAADRDAAIDRLRRALDETEVAGHPDDPAVPSVRGPERPVPAGDLSTDWVGECWDGPASFRRAARVAMLAAGLDAIAVGLGTATAGGRRAGPTSGPQAKTVGRWRRSVAPCGPLAPPPIGGRHVSRADGRDQPRTMAPTAPAATADG